MRVIEKRRVDYDPKGPPPRLTDPLLKILDLLQDFRYLPQSYIGKLLGYHTSIYKLGGRWLCYRILAQQCWRILAHLRPLNLGSLRLDRGTWRGLESQSGFVRASSSGGCVWCRHGCGGWRES